MTDLVESARRYVATSLGALANPEKAAGMQAYMKTDMPFYGVQKPQRAATFKHLRVDFKPGNHRDYQALVLGLWTLPHREEKYLALGVASAHREFVTMESIDLYRRLIVEGAWWDLVDTIATDLIRHLVLTEPDRAWEVVDSWIDDDDLWLRRSAILCQIGAKDRTDTDRLFGFCRQRAAEREFFIAKAIGWALREYAKTDPGAVASFVQAHRTELAPLSYREATKHIRDLVVSS